MSSTAGADNSTNAPATHNTMPEAGPSKTVTQSESSAEASSGRGDENQTTNATSSAHNTSNQTNNVRRVKVYQLDQESWTDLGTGYCDVYAQMPAGVTRHQSDELWADVEEEDEDAGPWIAVVPEHRTEGEPQELIWRTTIRAIMLLAMSQGEEDEDENAAYGFHRQQDTLIVWCEPDGVEMALSFANVQSCAEVWQFIHRVKQYLFEGNVPAPFDSGSSSDELTSSPQHFFNGSGLQLANQSGTLPPPSFDNIHHVQDSLKWQSRTPAGRERLANWIVKSDYVSSLIQLKSDAEDLESLDTLHALCIIMQTMLLLNENLIFDHIIGDEIFIGVAGILEYDPEFPKMKANYVSHLSDPARFVQVVPIQHGPTLQKIHQTYRLFYLKDVMLARIIDDPTYTMLNSFIFFHQIDIVQHLQQDQQFLDSLFHLFEQPADEEHPESVEKQREAILLLHQFCMLAKNLQLTARHTFYRTMADRGLLRALEVVLQRTAHLNSPSQSNKARTEAENAVRVTAIEILMMLIDHHPNSVRSYCLKSTSETSEEEENPEHVGRSLVSFLISLLSAEEDLGIQAQIAEAIKVLAHAGGLSPAAAASNAADHGLAENARLRNEDPEAEKFLQYFYDHCIGALFKPILDLPDPSEQPNGVLPLAVGPSGLFAQLCDLLVHFVGAHTFRSKYFVLSTPICMRVARLFKTTQKHLALAALRFFKATIVRKDDFYNRYLIKHDLLKPVLEAASSESDKDNLVASACLDFFEHIRLNNTKALLNYVMDQHGDSVRALSEHHQTIKLLILRWEQNNEPPPTESEEKNAAANRTGPYGNRQSNTLDDEEESYFNDSSSEDESEQAASQAHVEKPALVPMPSTSPAGNKKRKLDESHTRKRQRTDSSAPTLPEGRLSLEASASKANNSMVRSPALVFQEMAVKGAQRRSRSSASSESSPVRKAPSVSLVDYGDDDDDDDDVPPPLPAKDDSKASISQRLLTPPGAGKLKHSDSTDVLSDLGSPFQSIDPGASIEGQLDASEGDSSPVRPPPSLKSLGEKRAREEEEEDGLLKKKTKPNNSSGNNKAAAPAGTASSGGKGRGFAHGLTSKLKFNFGLGSGGHGGGSKKGS